LLSNPEAIKYAKETQGRSVAKGLKNFLSDLRHNNGMPSQVDKSRFRKGKDVAASPGAVVFRNELLELIQYQPSTSRVYQRPLFFCNSMINRYYMSDLTPQRSLFKYLIDQGFQLFSVVWRNPSPNNRQWGMEEYVSALIEAMEATKEISQQETINSLGLCAGGTVAFAAMAYLAQQDRNFCYSHTSLVNVVDNAADDTVLSILGTPKAVAAARKRIDRHGVFSADAMNLSFNMMQPDKLIWPYLVQNYLFGEEPQDSAVMYWMNDQVALPARLFNQFLDFMFNNSLAKGKFELYGTRIALSSIKTETLLIGAQQDHICPWRAGYRTRDLLGGKVEYLLSTGGHTTPMTAPSDDPRAKYYTNPNLTLQYDEWLAGAAEHNASWRGFWSDWLGKRSGVKIKAPVELGNKKYSALDPAPGTYVIQ
ncbi:MAG: PHA/PHB synthase family protein, partial [Pseudomonadales bacterium]